VIGVPNIYKIDAPRCVQASGRRSPAGSEPAFPEESLRRRSEMSTFSTCQPITSRISKDAR